MPRRQKFKDVMSVIEQRIRQGDYLLSSIPGERSERRSAIAMLLPAKMGQ